MSGSPDKSNRSSTTPPSSPDSLGMECVKPNSPQKARREQLYDEESICLPTDFMTNDLDDYKDLLREKRNSPSYFLEALKLKKVEKRRSPRSAFPHRSSHELLQIFNKDFISKKWPTSMEEPHEDHGDVRDVVEDEVTTRIDD